MNSYKILFYTCLMSLSLVLLACWYDNLQGAVLCGFYVAQSALAIICQYLNDKDKQ